MMSRISKLKDTLRQTGVRGVIASVLRHAAYRIDRKQINSAAESRQANEFLVWVRFAVPGMLCQGNVDAMEHAVANMPPGKPILEIGTFCGLSTIVLSYLLDKRSKTTSFYTCDKWEFEGQRLGSPLGDSPSVTHDVYREYVKSSFLRNMRLFSADRLPHTIECFSDEFFRRWFENEEAHDVFDRSVTLGG